MSERSPDGVSRQRLLRGVQSSSEKFIVPWTTMSWLKLARLRCCSPLRKSSCDSRSRRRIRAAAARTPRHSREPPDGHDPPAKIKNSTTETIARPEEEASAVATHKFFVTETLGAVGSFSSLRCATAVLEQPEKVDGFGLV